ncbi:MAG: tetratricopeptide repeat protein [Mangrovibacterium sp.]
MKRIYSIILLILGLTVNLHAQDSLLVQANRNYAAGRYEQAVKQYLEILNSKIESAEVYYNLGNAWYKSGQYTRAIINYERARLLAPRDEDIRFNLELANQHVVDAIDPLPQVFFIRWWNKLANQHTADGWARISLSSFILALILAGFFFFSKSSGIKRLAFWLGIPGIVISVFSYNFAARQEKLLTGHRFAIITQPSVTVKSSPSEGGTDLFLIHEGLKIEIRDSLGSWKEIRLADGNQGWLPENSLEKI